MEVELVVLNMHFLLLLSSLVLYLEAVHLFSINISLSPTDFKAVPISRGNALARVEARPTLAKVPWDDVIYVDS